MKFTGVTALTALAALVAPSSGAKSGSGACASGNKTLTVETAPDFVRPYVLPRFHGKAIMLTKTQTITFSITANSSGGAFTLVQHNGKVTNWLNARPHIHKTYHEHFYCARGRVELWTKRNGTSPDQQQEEARVASFGDYGNVPPGTIHTFQLVDPDSQLTHAFHPAGFEKLFDDVSSGRFSSEAHAPYVPDEVDEQPYGPMTPELHELFEPLDLFAVEEQQYIPRRDFVNGTASAEGLNWHNGTNELPKDNTKPYYVANNYGPKFLNTDSGYKVIQPISTVDNSHNGNFTMGTIIMSKKRDDETTPRVTLPHHLGIQMDDGQLVLSVKGYKTTYLLQGDVAFIPAGTPFSYHATVPFTKFLYLNAGPNGLEYELLKRSMPWGFPSYPVEAGFKAVQ
ncbi:RmlC-like jelly roll fold domain containing protein [Cordyceps fumosorosea ARSEF 2679]|uniref:RmlC-like jelly roll fold domain containing protein n=1 Tax=Cordyceps fumosorosea (strain ARSEF 2679) TaxID=1081104 RepID=A0A162MLI9_CORFA|nr:RmlC-like jelly roll fold domain containing protein [Cordyceps fumosorosea ARSEF 2679]OAA63800.1 RmlC-like jelly roll fold domain containing protein [Cordyceps fumosorosea ARSEF 2679]